MASVKKFLMSVPIHCIVFIVIMSGRQCFYGPAAGGMEMTLFHNTHIVCCCFCYGGYFVGCGSGSTKHFWLEEFIYKIYSLFILPVPRLQFLKSLILRFAIAESVKKAFCFQDNSNELLDFKTVAWVPSFYFITDSNWTLHSKEGIRLLFYC